MGWLSGAVRWAVLAGFYLVLAGQVPAAELVAGALAGAAGVALSLLLERAAPRRFRLSAPWLGIAVKLVWCVLRDVHRVALALMRTIAGGTSGAVLRQPFIRTPGNAAGAGHRAVAVLLASVAPNGYVLAEESDALILHRLAEAPPSADRAWPL